MPASEPGDDEYTQRFHKAMDDDFNTPEAIAVLFDLAGEVNKARETDMEQALMLASTLKRLANILGLLEADAESYLQAGVGDAGDSSEIEALIAKRLQARADKDWAEADRIRDQLNDMGIELEDKGGETLWRRA